MCCFCINPVCIDINALKISEVIKSTLSDADHDPSSSNDEDDTDPAPMPFTDFCTPFSVAEDVDDDTVGLFQTVDRRPTREGGGETSPLE